MNKQLLLFIGIVFVGLISLGIVFFLVKSGVQKPQNAVPSHASGTDTTTCQGNSNPPAKCFKCETGTNKNNPISILDFQCFSKFYGQTVGKP